MPGWCVFRADWNEFGGGVALLVKYNVHHSQFILPNIVNLETITVCFCLHNNTHLLFVSHYNPPDFPVLHCDLDSVFSSFDSVTLVGDTNCKHTAWKCISVDRNSRKLLSYCLSQNTAINYPDHPTYSHTSFQPSVLDITLSIAYCPNHCLSLHSPMTITQWYLRFYYVPPFPNLIWFSIICMLTGQFSIPQ